MKFNTLKLAAFMVLPLALELCPVSAAAQGTAFTYQGRLNNASGTVSGSYDFRFAIYDSTNVSGNLIAGPLTNSATTVSNGLFVVTLDFGPGVFAGASRCLDIAARTNGPGAFVELSPRQPLTAAPYATYAAAATTAASATSAASVPASGIGAGTANISISGNAATATTAASAGLAATATMAATATTATTAASAQTAATALTAGTATNLIGILPDAQLSTNIARLNGTNLLTGTNTFSNALIATNPANQIYGTFTGSGAGLTGLSAISLAPGSITAALLAPGAVSELGTPNGSSTNAVVVTTNGTVGIGTNAPVAGLQVTATSTEAILGLLFETTTGQNGYTNLQSVDASAINGDLVALGGISEVALFNLSNPSYPVAQIPNGTGAFTNLSGVESLAWAGSNLVAAAANSSAVTIISCTNPASPVLVAQLQNNVNGWNYLSWVNAVAVSGNLLAIGAYNSSAVTLADISNPSAPVLKSVILNGQYGFTNMAGVQSVALSGNLLAIAAWNSTAVTLVNVSNPSNPIKLAEFVNGVGVYTNLSYPMSVALSSNLLAIAAEGSSVVTLVDVSNPASPVKVAELANDVGGYALNSPRCVVLSSNQLAVCANNDAGHGAVDLVDVSHPSSPVLLATAIGGLNGVDYMDSAYNASLAGTNLVVCGVKMIYTMPYYNYLYGFGLFGLTTRQVGVDSSGWVGIGTTHPTAALDVVGNVMVENASLFDVSAQQVAIGSGACASGVNSIALGYEATAEGYDSIALGYAALASGYYATALGYQANALGNYSLAFTYATASGPYSIAGGPSTRVSGNTSIGLGYVVNVTGNYSTGLGYYTQITNNGCFAWSDNSGYPGVSSTNDNSVIMRAAGGYRLYSNGGMTAGVTLAPGGTAWATVSDQNAKKNFAPVNGEAVLDKLSAVPVEQWHYKWEADTNPPNIGPMAQAFKAAFYPGRDDKSITTLEFDGVELAAIQGLNQKLENKSRQLENENAELKAQLAELKGMVERLDREQKRPSQP